MQHIDTLRIEPLFVQLTWSNGLLSRIELRWSAAGDESLFQTNWGAIFQESLHRYLSGSATTWPKFPLDWGRCTAFSRQVLGLLQDVPAGEWLSYGELAARCGRPKAARAVGRVMAANPWPLVIPCHRVLGGKGGLTGFGPGLELKAFLLRHEGVFFASPERAPGKGSRTRCVDMINKCAAS